MIKISYCLGMVLFLFMLCLPFQAQTFKFFLVVILGFLALIRGPIKLPKKNVFYWLVIFIVANAFFLGLGILNGFMDSALLLLKVHLVWPLLYLFFLPFLSNMGSLIAIQKCLVISSYFIGVVYVFFSIFPESQIFELMNIQVGSGKNLVFYASSPALTSMLFIGPFLISTMYIFLAKKSTLRKFMLIFFANILCFFVAAISGRRMLQLAFLLAPLLHLFFSQSLGRLDRKKYLRIFLGAAGVMVGALLLFSLWFPSLIQEVSNNFVEGFAFDGGATITDPGAMIRKQQFVRLISAWLEAPFLGHGSGAYLGDFIRSEENRSSYELTYIALLFQTGVVGICTYALLIAWIYRKTTGIVKYRRKAAETVIPILVGFTCFLLGNGTNPYLYSFDHIWVLFLPLVLIGIERDNAWSDDVRSFGGNSNS